uniref:AP complex mu/sigma subunit domain-containing protein n=1 Tax=Felis catus TaxID=9685 RepID=A0ABI8AK83_FELCA
MSASAVFILDVKGKPLISRNYKGDVAMSEIENFMPLLMQREEEGALAPLLSHGRVHFLWIKHSNLYLVATTLKNANASLVYSFLYKTVEVFSEYFKELEEESIRDNFVIVYELLDELMDFGFPQTTDSKILQEYITQQGNKLETGKSRVPPTVTNAVSWRSEGIKYKKNEVFIDVIESVNLLEARTSLWNWKTSNSTSVCGCLALTMTALSPSSHPTATLSSCPTASAPRSSR